MRLGVLGLGSIGLRHAKNLLWLKEHEVFGFDPSEDRQALFASYGGHPATRKAIMACDKVVMASPTPAHYDDLKDCQKPTLAEKPLADRPIDFDISHVTLVGYNLRYHSCVRQAKSWLKMGRIGEPLNGQFVLAQFNEKPSYLRDGVTLNWSHELDVCLHLLGNGEALAATSKNSTASNHFIIHKGGCVSTVHLNYINKREERYFTILGTKGKIHCVLSPYRTAELTSEDEWEAVTYQTNFDDDYIAEIKAFLSGDIGPGCTANEGLEVLKICLGL